MKFPRFSALALTSTALLLTACGGGGGSSSTPAIPPGGGGGGTTGPTWTAGSFEPASNFKSNCSSTLYQNHWLRSWSDETYLWYNEIPDQDPATFTNVLDYFDELRTEATTASGAPKDKFHFTYDTDEYQELVNSGASAGYGARFRLLSSSPPRQAVIAYVEAGSPAAAAGLKRGDSIVSVDGTALVDGDPAVLNAGLFPDGAGESHNFTVQPVGTTDEVDVSMNSAIVTSKPVHTLQTGGLANGETAGYVLFNTFGTSIAEEDLFDAFTSLADQNVDHLVMDLRYNGGGFLDISAELAYMIAGPAATNGSIYETLVFNGKSGNTNPVTGQPITPTPFHSTAQGFSVNEGTPLPTLNLDTVYVLSTSSTCSASESLINSLEGIDVKVVLIGTTTCGKPYGFYGTDNCGTTFFTIQFRGENDKGFGDYSDGFSPSEGQATTGEPIEGCIVTDDFNNELGDDSEALLNAAFTHIETGSCPAATAAKPESFVNYAKPTSFAEGSLLADPRIEKRLMLENSRILNHPGRQ